MIHDKISLVIYLPFVYLAYLYFALKGFQRYLINNQSAYYKRIGSPKFTVQGRAWKVPAYYWQFMTKIPQGFPQDSKSLAAARKLRVAYIAGYAVMAVLIIAIFLFYATL